MNLKELYQELILEHGKNPRNLGKTENFNKNAKGNNPLCGDNLKLTFFINNEDVIEDIKFTGEGCAISLASASLMTEKLKGKKIDTAEEIFSDFTNLVSGTSEDLKVLNEEDSLYALKGVGGFPMRVKCATMAWHAFKSALKS